ncbi:FmdB family zinc ribbon protein [Methylotuvimicrobium alcaliphilum]|uniref:Regulatory protein, FmdB family n=1 Tax=Methylotuvimicrobium alcaliphilum (strain DSM 19304 / NCIMB 14124 / VKM B-2133 / 20Z) TaxID=1091494 RepID=G4STG6_META2|nr:zinc ribbon domain-containing protein [Methylotuvimicrobium alcaliphilum]CCE23922.1 Regulatory protein, FmdB family [Methylotuvimicrobium alcaliphilum 20Z]
MPIYEYQCQACGHEHEALQKMSDPVLVHCPACSRPELMKKISAAGFRLKGGGWYETDFKSGNKKNVAGEASAPASCSSTDSGCGGGACSAQ